MALRGGQVTSAKRKEAMRIIISPAKKMRVDTDSIPWCALPTFISQTEVILERLRSMSKTELQRLWKCNDKITEQNTERVRNMSLRSGLTPAILAYEGIQYQYMAPGVFTDTELKYVQEHLRIISGFYGILRPFDGVTPYRLEMQAKLQIEDKKDLYAYWGDVIANSLCAETDCIVNLASKEYSVCVSKYLPETVRMVTCIFGEEINGKVVEKGTMCKMARGEMVRFMAERSITDPLRIKEFDRLGFSYAEQYSDHDRYVFLRSLEVDDDEDGFR